jgi:hypothetical protein
MYRTPRADNRTSYPASGACGRETRLTPLSPMSCAISGRPHSTISASSVLCARTPTSWRHSGWSSTLATGPTSRGARRRRTRIASDHELRARDFSNVSASRVQTWPALSSRVTLRTAYRGSPVPVTRHGRCPATQWAAHPRRCRPNARASVGHVRGTAGEDDAAGSLR